MRKTHNNWPKFQPTRDNALLENVLAGYSKEFCVFNFILLDYLYLIYLFYLYLKYLIFFFHRHLPQILDDLAMDDFVPLIVILLCNYNYIANPYLVAKLVEVWGFYVMKRHCNWKLDTTTKLQWKLYLGNLAEKI